MAAFRGKVALVYDHIEHQQKQFKSLPGYINHLCKVDLDGHFELQVNMETTTLNEFLCLPVQLGIHTVICTNPLPLTAPY